MVMQGQQSQICTHGDIKVRMPELAKVLRDAIEDVRPVGRRIIFEYYIFLGVYHMGMYPDYAYYIKVWLDYIFQGYTTTVKFFGAYGINTEISRVNSYQLSHCVRRYKPISSFQALKYYKEAWTDGWVLALPRIRKLSWNYN